MIKSEIEEIYSDKIWLVIKPSLVIKCISSDKIRPLKSETQVDELQRQNQDLTEQNRFLS